MLCILIKNKDLFDLIFTASHLSFALEGDDELFEVVEDHELEALHVVCEVLPGDDVHKVTAAGLVVEQFPGNDRVRGALFQTFAAERQTSGSAHADSVMLSIAFLNRSVHLNVRTVWVWVSVCVNYRNY